MDLLLYIINNLWLQNYFELSTKIKLILVDIQVPLWVFTDKEALTLRYAPKSFDIENQINTFVNIVSPKDNNDGNALWVYQKTFFYLGIFDSNTTMTYEVKIPKNGVYLFLIEGEIEVDNHVLKARDALGIIDFNLFEIRIKTKSKILLVEVPMNNS